MRASLIELHKLVSTLLSHLHIIGVPICMKTKSVYHNITCLHDPHADSRCMGSSLQHRLWKTSPGTTSIPSELTFGVCKTLLHAWIHTVLFPGGDPLTTCCVCMHIYAGN